MCSPRRIGRERVSKAPKTTHKMNSACRKRTAVASAEYKPEATKAEAANWLEGRAGIEPYQGGFLLHYLDKLVYPDISANVLTIAGVVVCLSNLAFYVRQMRVSHRAHH